MSTLGNVIWVIFGGLILSLGYILVGLLFCLTIIGIPFGVQLMKIGGFALLPFGRTTVPGVRSSGCLYLVANIVWIILAGWELALCHVVLGLCFCVTIIGIPFGLQHFKLALVALAPFGQDIVPTSYVGR